MARWGTTPRLTPELVEKRKRRAKASRQRMAARGIRTDKQRQADQHPAGKGVS